MSEHSQFTLLKERRYLPFFISQLAGAFNDNVFKQALILAIIYKLTFSNFLDQQVITSLFHGGQIDKDLLVNLCAIVFILPFFLFSALGGQLGEKYEKSLLIRRIKIAEIITMIIGAVGLFLSSFVLMLIVLFAMGVLSALFGPVKYSILPQHLKDSELIGGNALVEMGTFLAILTGTLLAGVLMTGNGPYAYYISFCILLIAIIGYLASRKILHSPAPMPNLKVSFNVFSQTWKTMQLGFNQKLAVSRSILGNSWFWFLGTIYITQMPNYAEKVLNGDPSAYTLILIVFSVSIALGSILCEKLSGHKVEIGLVPFGSIGLTVFSILLWWHSYTLPMVGGVSNTWLTLLAHPQTWFVLIDIFGIGLFGGFYIVPLYAIMQSRSAPEERARVIAANNILNALFMVLASIVAIILLSIAGLSIPQLFLVVGLMNIAVNAYIFNIVPEFTLRFMMWLTSHSVYNVSHQGLDNIPEKGSCVIVSNHISYVDALLIGGAIKRPICFVMHYKIFNMPIVKFAFRKANAIPIAGYREDKEVFEKAFIEIAKALQKGQLVCIFPEGKLTTDGEIAEFKAGIEKIIKETPVPVVPLAIQGLWKTSFSRNPKRKILRSFGAPINIIADKAIPAEQVTRQLLQEKVQELRGDKA
ncbi:MFS transporter [Entomomonas sp. E2T0]|uniref:MFS transporter n=1 Tax=Entomomonas sp. E2T0 TaxID=2930213 RepID=UPI002228175B|nr:MFS transporter [Entomomonas sp. E2T0]UYZ83784.1 MFS transporter [Entomomonas sp. E2T0]